LGTGEGGSSGWGRSQVQGSAWNGTREKTVSPLEVTRYTLSLLSGAWWGCGPALTAVALDTSSHSSGFPVRRKMAQTDQKTDAQRTSHWHQGTLTSVSTSSCVAFSQLTKEVKAWDQVMTGSTRTVTGSAIAPKENGLEQSKVCATATAETFYLWLRREHPLAGRS
jgi:hypothetical protein